MWKERTVKDVVLKVKCVIFESLVTLKRTGKVKTASNMELPLVGQIDPNSPNGN